MLVTRKSIVSGKEHTMNLDVTEAQLQELQSPGRRMIQDIFPNLPADEREFLLSGTTPEEWKAIFGGDEE
jgi:hypothetical protein